MPLILGKILAISLAVTVVGYLIVTGHSEANPPSSKATPAKAGAQVSKDGGAEATKTGAEGSSTGKSAAKATADAGRPAVPPVFMHSSKSGVFRRSPESDARLLGEPEDGGTPPSPKGASQPK